jgi:glycosyltransferase EpsH
MENSLISIVIPIYKSELFIERLYNSLKQQTYSKLEIIFVNDGSPDNSGAICDELANSDERVIVLHQENQGAAIALNHGIINSSGEFIMFIDADDWIEKNTCELAINAALAHNVDLVFWPNIKEYANESVKYPSFFPSSREFKNEDIMFLRRRMMGLVNEELKYPMSTDAFNSGWGKLYRTEIIKTSGVIWKDTKIVGSSDVLFNAQLMPFINGAYYLDIYLQHYNKNNPNSLTKTYNNTLKIKLENLFIELNNVIKENYLETRQKEFKQALNNRIAISTINISLGYVSKGISYSSYVLFKKLISSNPYTSSYVMFTIKYLPFYYRPFFFFCKCNFALPAYFMLLMMSKLRQK